MPAEDDDRETMEELSEALGEDREELEGQEDYVGAQARGQSLHVNAQTGEMISPNGVFGDDAIAHFEQLYREQLAVGQTLLDAAEILAQADEDEPGSEDDHAA